MSRDKDWERRTDIRVLDQHHSWREVYHCNDVEVAAHE